jgi:hypothetical protein
MRVSSLVFTSLQFTAEVGNKDGFAFTAALQQVDITSAQVVEVGELPMVKQDAGKAATPQAAQMSNAGTQTTVTQTISSSAYASYVNSYNGNSSPGPTTRQTPNYNGVSAA